ncbi:MAG: c-type cytochrome [Gemmatimonadota bacterium]
MVLHWSRRVAVGLLLAGVAACNQAPPPPSMSRGKALFDNCVPCHGAEGHGSEELKAPNIAGLPQWYVQAQLEKFQAAHRGGNPWDTTGIRMKSMSWTLDLPGDVESVAEYVASMPKVASQPTLEGGNAQAGQATYQVCSACHGPDGKGNQAVKAPPLVGQADWYLLAQLHKFKAGWRGADPEDVSGGTMRPNTLALDDAAMANVVAYISTLQ